MIKKTAFSWIFLVFLSTVSGSALGFGTARMTLQTDTAPHLLYLQTATTREQRKQGLQERVSILPYHGMLFDFGREESISMWMKNTPMPLDMFFINKKGRIIYIHENTTPYSMDAISAEEPVRYVLEMPAGSANRYGIMVGNSLEIP